MEIGTVVLIFLNGPTYYDKPPVLKNGTVKMNYFQSGVTYLIGKDEIYLNSLDINGTNYPEYIITRQKDFDSLKATEATMSQYAFDIEYNDKNNSKEIFVISPLEYSTRSLYYCPFGTSYACTAKENSSQVRDFSLTKMMNAFELLTSLKLKQNVIVRRHDPEERPSTDEIVQKIEWVCISILFLMMNSTSFVLGFFSEDKSKGMKDYLYMAGLSPMAYWLGNFLAMILMFLQDAIVISVACYFAWKLPVMIGVFYFAALFMFLLCSMIISLCLSSIFPGTNGMIRGLIVAFIFSVLPLILSTWYSLNPSQIPYFVVFGSCAVSPPVNISFMLISLFFYQNDWTSRKLENVPSLQWLALLLVLNLSGNLLIIIFSEIFNEIVRCFSGVSDKVLEQKSACNWPVETLNRKGKVQSVFIDHVTMMFTKKSKKCALDDVTLEVFKNEVFALLGHNGSGKSTLLSIIGGLLKPTRGTVWLGTGKRSLGCCFQNDIFYESLSVKSHLQLLTSIRGFRGAAARQRIDEIASKLEIEDLLSQPAFTLSGGQRRMVSTAMAFIGYPDLIILDEPTSGMDPENRRVLWRFLEAGKRLTTVILCTHYVDEADIVADRKAFLFQGKVQCVGSSLFLKEKYLVGHIVSLESIDGYNEMEIFDAAERFNCRMSVKKRHESYVEYLIRGGDFDSFLFHIERQKNELKISNFYVRENDLDQILLDSDCSKGYQFKSLDRVRTVMKRYLEGPKHHNSFFSLLCNQIRVSLPGPFSMIGKILSVAAYLSISYVLIHNDNPFLFEETKMPLENVNSVIKLFHNLKFGYHCPGFKAPEFFEPWLDKSATEFNSSIMVGFIKCTKSKLIIEYNSLYPMAGEYSLYIGLKAKTDPNIFFGYKQTKPKFSPELQKTISASMTILASYFVLNALLSPFSHTISVTINDRKSIQFPLYTFGVGPFSFYLTLFLKSFIISSPLIGMVYAYCYFDIVSKLGLSTFNFTLFFVLYVIEQFLTSMFLGTIIDNVEVASTFYSTYSTVFPLILGFVSKIFESEVFQKTMEMIVPSNQLMSFFSGFDKKDDDLMILFLVPACFSILFMIGIFVKEQIQMFKTTQRPTVVDKDCVTTENLTMRFGHKMAVRNLNLTLKKQKLFALLGVNGSGKTTALKVILSQLFPTQGCVRVFGVNPHSSRFKALPMIGYCPQYDSMLIPKFTVKQNLMFYGRLLLSLKEMDILLYDLPRCLGFAEFMDVPACFLSGGTKRKLCVAISLLAPRPLLILDEPTTGVDAVCRSMIWKTLDNLSEFRSTIITTHYMMEASLCDEIAIMVNGTIRAQGTEYELTLNYARGYFLNIKTNESTPENVASYIKGDILSDCGAVSIQTNVFGHVACHMHCSYSVTELVRRLSDEKKNGHITDYSLSRMNLDDVFLNVASKAAVGV